MPSKTPKQARFMAAVAHGWKPTQKGVKAPPLKVAREFNKADKGKDMKMQFGGLAQARRGRGRRGGFRGRQQQPPGVGQGMARPAVQPGGGQQLQPPMRGVGRARSPALPQRAPPGGLAQSGRARGLTGGARPNMRGRMPARPSGASGIPGYNSLGPQRAADARIQQGGRGAERMRSGPPYGMGTEGMGMRGGALQQYKEGGKVSKLYQVTVSLRDWVKGKGELHQRETKEVRASSPTEAREKVEAKFPELRAGTVLPESKLRKKTPVYEDLARGGRKRKGGEGSQRAGGRRSRKGRTKREEHTDERGKRKKEDARARRKRSRKSTKRG